MAKVHVLWAQKESYSNDPAVILQAFADRAAADAVKTVVEACEPKMALHITEVEFIGAATPALHLPKDDPYKGRAYIGGALAGYADNALGIPPVRPPDPPKHPLVKLAEKIHDEAEA